MGRVIFIEVLDRRGRVRERTRVERFPARIGRAYSNDVILADRYVSPHHAEIRENAEGELVIEDLDSTNGIEPLGGAASFQFIASGSRARLGETVIRFVSADHPVPRADPLAPKVSGLRDSLKDLRVSVALVVAAFSMFVVENYLARYQDFSVSAIVGPAVAGVGFLAFWAGNWAVANRLITHRFEFHQHLALTCLATIGSMALWTLGEYVEFFSSQLMSYAIVFVMQVLLLALLLYGHLSIISTSTRSGRRRWAFGVTLVVLSLAVLFTYAEPDEFTSDIEITVPLKPFGADWIPAVTTEEFLARSRRAKQEVDAAKR